MSRCEMTLVFNIVCSYANKMIKEKYPNSFVRVDGKSKNPQRYWIYDWEHIEEFSVNIVTETQERVYNFTDSITFKLFKRYNEHYFSIGFWSYTNSRSWCPKWNPKVKSQDLISGFEKEVDLVFSSIEAILTKTERKDKLAWAENLFSIERNKVCPPQ